MGNNLNSKNPEDFTLEKKEIEIAKTTWQIIVKAGLAECGTNFMTR